MSDGFYERLGVAQSATLDEIKAAYQRKLAELVSRLRSARRRGADVRILESRERALREAMDVLQDQARRRRYDAFVETHREGLPADADELWERSRSSMVDPVAAAALASVQALTDLPTGDPLPELVAELADGPSPGPLPILVEETEPTSQVIDFSEESPTVADELDSPRPVEVHVEESREPMLSLDAPLPEAHTDLFEGEPAPARVSVAPAAPAPVEAAQESVSLDGRFLAQARQEKGISLEELASTTRISERYLVAIEENAFDKLPAAPFVRGYVRQVAQILGVEDRGVVEGFMDLYTHHRG